MCNEEITVMNWGKKSWLMDEGWAGKSSMIFLKNLFLLRLGRLNFPGGKKRIESVKIVLKSLISDSKTAP